MAAFQGGFKPNTPVIDLTGQYPGILYIIGAKAIGQPWMTGGYSVAIKILSKVKCEEIATAWILYDPSSTAQLSPEILQNFGLDLHKDYSQAAKFNPPMGVGGRNPNISHQQLLLKPTRPVPDVTKACKMNQRKIL